MYFECVSSVSVHRMVGLGIHDWSPTESTPVWFYPTWYKVGFLLGISQLELEVGKWPPCSSFSWNLLSLYRRCHGVVIRTRYNLKRLRKFTKENETGITCNLCRFELALLGAVVFSDIMIWLVRIVIITRKMDGPGTHLGLVSSELIGVPTES